MARQVFFHIGTPKSGTTFLQDILWKNKTRLAEQGILLPCRRGDNFHATMVVREDPGVHKRHYSAPSAWDRIVEETRRWDGAAVISHEFFGGASADQAKRALDDLAPAEVHLVVTARDYAAVIPAAWQEWVKIRYPRSLTDFLRDDVDGGPLSEWGWRTADVVAILDRWARHVPPERVHVVTVPPAGAAPNLLWRRFARLCGIDPDSCEVGGARPNQSLGAAEVELMRRVGPKVTPPIEGAGEVTRWVRDTLAHQVLAPRQGRRFGLSPTDAAMLREKSRLASDTLAASHFDIVGDPAELVPPEAPAELPHPDTVTDAELVNVAAETIAEMLQRYRKQTLEADRQRRRADEAEHALAEARVRAARKSVPSCPARVRRLLIDLSERYPVAMKARVRYRKARDAARRG